MLVNALTYEQYLVGASLRELWLAIADASDGSDVTSTPDRGGKSVAFNEICGPYGCSESDSRSVTPTSGVGEGRSRLYEALSACWRDRDYLSSRSIGKPAHFVAAIEVRSGKLAIFEGRRFGPPLASYMCSRKLSAPKPLLGGCAQRKVNLPPAAAVSDHFHQARPGGRRQPGRWGYKGHRGRLAQASW